MTKERNDFVQKVARAEEDRKSMSMQLATLDSQNRGLSSNVNKKIDDARLPLEKQIEELKADLANIKVDADSSAGTIGALRAENARLSAEAQKLAEAVKAKNTEIASKLADSRVELEAKIAQLEKIVQEKQADIKQKELALSLASLKTESMVKDADLVKQDKDSVQQEFIQDKERLNGELLLLKNEKKALEARYAEVATQLADVQAASRGQVDAVKRPLEAKIEALEEALRKKEADIDVFRQKSDAKAKDLKSVQDELKGAMELIK